MIKVDTLLKNKPLIFLDKIMRFLGWYIVIECDLETRIVSGWHIDKIYK